MVLGKPLLTVEQVRERVSAMARQMGRDYDGKDLVVVGILKGSFMFMADLVRQINVPLEVDFIKCSSYAKTESTGCITMLSDLTVDIKGRHVLLVEDIIDTGITMGYLRDHFLSLQPASFKICAFLSKPSRRQVEGLKIDYVGFEIPDVFAVGYGLDYEHKFRNLPYVSVLITDK